MPQVVGDIQLHMGPQQVGGPDDLRKTIVDFIDGAKRRLDINGKRLDLEALFETPSRAEVVCLHAQAAFRGPVGWRRGSGAWRTADHPVQRVEHVTDGA